MPDSAVDTADARRRGRHGAVDRRRHAAHGAVATARVPMGRRGCGDADRRSGSLPVVVPPSLVQQPLGLTENVAATVADVRLDAKSAKRSGSRWQVDLTWAGAGTVRSGTGRVREPAPPFRIGQVSRSRSPGPM